MPTSPPAHELLIDGRGLCVRKLVDGTTRALVVEKGTLSLRDCGLGEASLTLLSNELWSGSIRCRALDLAGNNIRGGEGGGAASLARALRGACGTVSLDVSRNPLGDVGAREISSVLLTEGTAIAALEVLRMMRCGMSDEGMLFLARSLANNGTLRRLILTGNRIGAVGVEALCASGALGGGSCLIELGFGNNMLDTEAANTLGRALSRRPPIGLRILSVSGNPLMGDTGIKAIMRGASMGNCLSELHVSGCGMTSRGSKYIAEGLEAMTNLTQLDIRNNEVGDEGMETICMALISNTTLLSLHVDSCNLQLPGARSIGQAIGVNRSLLCLTMSGNFIGEKGIKQVAAGLASNSTLIELNLSDCGGTPEGFAEIAAILEGQRGDNCTSLRVLKYSGNCLSNMDMQRLDRGLLHVSKVFPLSDALNNIECSQRDKSRGKF